MSKMSRYIIALVVTAVILFLVWFFSNIVAYIVVSAVIAIIAKPLVNLVTGLKVGRVCVPKWAGALITLIAVWGIIALLFAVFVPLIFAKANQISTSNISDTVAALKEPLASVDLWIKNMFAIGSSDFSIVDATTNQLGSVFNIEFINKMVTSVATTVIDIVIAAFSISFITFFFLKEEDLFRDMVVAVFPQKHEQKIINVIESVTNLLMRYFRGIVTESSIMTAIVTIGLSLFGIPLQDALLIGLCTGLLNVIPYLGPIIGICVGIFLGVVGGAPASMTLVFMMTCIAGTILFAQLVDNLILQPVLYAKNAKAHPLEIFIVILMAGSIAGVVGMLLAIPSYNVIRVFAKEFFNKFSVVQKLTSKI